MDNVMVVLVFCFHTEQHRLWADNYSKVAGVTKSFSEAIKVTKEMLQDTMSGKRHDKTKTPYELKQVVLKEKSKHLPKEENNPNRKKKACSNQWN